MSQKIAVAIIHGVGDQGPEFAKAMSDKLKAKLKSIIPEENADINDHFYIIPVFWASILAKKQRRLWQTINAEEQLNFDSLRKFMLNFIGDAVAYQPSQTRRQVYEQIHDRYQAVLQDLAIQAGGEAPLCVIAHSLGTIITNNFFFDLGRALAEDPQSPPGRTPLESGQTLALVYTLGSPLALWSLRYDNYVPPPFPGQILADLYPNARPQWINFYDKDDIISYPIRSISPGYAQLVQLGLLEDRQVNVGGLLSSWNILSHFGYWTDPDVVDPIANSLFELWQAINPPPNYSI